ncbi:MAG: NPCBM/NEW2 domain-containing protein [Acidobacteriota bacterium]|jgi:hypothetical protein
MRRTLRYALILFIPLFVLAAAAEAGVVYVPYPGPVEIGGVEYETQIWASNTDDQTIRRIEHLFLRSLSDGTDREDDQPTVVRIPPGVTTRLRIAEPSSGMIEILAAPQVVINARLVRTIPGSNHPPSGAQLPVISSENAAEAGQTLHLQGWERIEDLISSNLGIVNLGDDQVQCEVSVFRADSSQIASTALVRFNARSHVQYRRALAILQAGEVQDVRGEVTCDQPFYAYASVFYDRLPDEATAPTDVVFIEPSATGGSALNRPVDEGDFVYLDELAWSDTRNIRNGPHKNVSGWDPHAGNHGVGGYKKIEINGVEYDHGISWFPGWGDSWVAWRLDGAYQRFTATVRVDDEKTGEYEWGVVNRSTGEFLDLKRPAGGFRAPETSNQFRIGAGASIRIYGDGQLLFESGEFYAYGPAVQVDVDVTGVQVLRIELEPDHHELAEAPHRNGHPSTPALVKRCSWFDLIDLADAKLFNAN